MNARHFLALSAGLVLAGSISSYAAEIPTVTPPAGNTASSSGLSGGPGLGDTPTTATTGGDVDELDRRTVIVRQPGATTVTTAATGGTIVTPATPTTGTVVTTPATRVSPGIGDSSSGTTRSSGVGIGESSTTRDVSAPSYGTGVSGSGTSTRAAVQPGVRVQPGAGAATAPTSEGNATSTPRRVIVR